MAMNLRLTEEADRILSAMAREDGVSKNEEINRAILERGAWVSHEKNVRAQVHEAISNFAPARPLTSLPDRPALVPAGGVDATGDVGRRVVGRAGEPERAEVKMADPPRAIAHHG
jgi:hypothetical protein